MPQAILIVMQDVLFSQTLRHKLSHFGVKVFITETAVQALELLGMRKMDVVLLDVRGNNLPAVQFLKDLKKSGIGVETILISSIDDVSISIECMREGASDEITLPFDIESLNAKINEAITPDGGRWTFRTLSVRAMNEPRHYAGVVIAVEPGRLAEVVPALAALEGATVHQREAATGRCVVVLESADRDGQERLFRAVQALPGVREASLVYHLVDAENLSRLVLEESAP